MYEVTNQAYKELHLESNQSLSEALSRLTEDLAQRVDASYVEIHQVVQHNPKHYTVIFNFKRTVE